MILEIPDSIVLSLRGTNESVSQTMKRAMAAKLYDDEMLSLGEASSLAEMNKVDFMEYLGESDIAVIRFDNDNCSGELEADVANSRKIQ